MASSFSTDLKLELMVTGENAGTWGTKTNTNLNLLQQAVAGYQEVSIAGGAQTTALVMTDAALSNARNAVIKFTGTITGNQVVTIQMVLKKFTLLLMELQVLLLFNLKQFQGQVLHFQRLIKAQYLFIQMEQT